MKTGQCRYLTPCAWSRWARSRQHLLDHRVVLEHDVHAPRLPHRLGRTRRRDHTERGQRLDFGWRTVPRSDRVTALDHGLGKSGTEQTDTKK